MSPNKEMNKNTLAEGGGIFLILSDDSSILSALEGNVGGLKGV